MSIRGPGPARLGFGPQLGLPMGSSGPFTGRSLQHEQLGQSIPFNLLGIVFVITSIHVN